MNVLLLEAHCIDAAGQCVLTGRQAKHLRDVLRVAPGHTVRVGIVDGAMGRATVLADQGDQITIAVQLPLTEQPTSVADTLLLAVPRPKVLMRMLAHAAAMGFARIVLFRSWRVDKTWLQSRAFDPDVQREQLLLGLEQAGRTQLPEVLRFDRFKPMVEDVLPTLNLPQPRFVAHPYAATATHQLARWSAAAAPRPFEQIPAATSPSQAFTLAIGPDGGFLPYEVEALTHIGFHAISCGPHALRTETALAALWGQLDLLRQQR